jgi:hypothetical protein
MSTPAMLTEPRRAELVASWRRQAQREEEMLGRLHEGLERVRRLLLAGTVAAVDEAQEIQRDLESLLGELDGYRSEWLDAVALPLGIRRTEMRVSLFAERIGGPERVEILAERDRLRARAQRLSTLGPDVRMLLRTRLDMLQRFFCDVTGVERTPPRYGRAGRTVAPSYGSILERRG